MIFEHIKHILSCKLSRKKSTTQQKSYFISHLLVTVTTQWLNSDGVVTVVNYRQHNDYTV